MNVCREMEEVRGEQWEVSGKRGGQMDGKRGGQMDGEMDRAREREVWGIGQENTLKREGERERKKKERQKERKECG